MKYWLISDTHFNHDMLVKWGHRPVDFEVTLWEGLYDIPEEDTLIHLGDVCMGNDAMVHETIKNLRCQKILIRGNHDKKSVSWYLDHGWDFVMDGMHLEYMGETLLLTHRPMHPDMWRFTKNIHGHTHGNLHRAEEYINWYETDFHIDLSPELVGYKPQLLGSIIKQYARPKKNRESHKEVV